MPEPILSAVIAIITCQRPRGLEKLLCALQQLNFPNFPIIRVRIVVVENGRKLEAEKQVARFRESGLEVVYAHEPTPGISHARNCAIRLALPRGDYVALIDDDEYPEPDWLDALLLCAREYDAPVVRGPVLPIFPDDAPAWAVEGGFFSRERFATGTEIRYCASNNVLIESALLRGAEIHFDSRFALSGGEDTLFFEQLRKQTGARILWCDGAVVYEDVAQSRLNSSWIKRRATREGSNMPQYDAVMGGGRFFRIRWVVQGLAHVMLASLICLVGFFKNEVMRIRGRQKLALGIGMIRGSLGHTINEYSERHGA